MDSPNKSTYRLLYRGALSLPDSHLYLDGITFSARLDAGHNLFENPLALALESMRGRPALRFMGVTSMKDIHIDDSGGILMDIHPEATLSRIYFENMFCLPTTSTDTIGIRIALGDSDGPETTQIIVYIKSLPSEDSNSSGAQLSVARITPGPPVAKVRAPRPDDPTPRKPPSHSSTRSRDLRRVSTANLVALNAQNRKQAQSDTLAASLGSGVRLGKAPPEFKVPQLPPKDPKGKAKEKGKGKAAEQTEADVFNVGNKGVKRKRAEEHETQSQSQIDATENEIPMERDNKNRIKRATHQHLISASVQKSHPEYKEVFNYIYRGTCFSLRSEIKSRPVEQNAMERVVAMHMALYAPHQSEEKRGSDIEWRP
ncbi:hypothetical protein WG66_000869 [Moniliophthora roreri]|uniref:Sld7 C-terminal domain-containing protein n=1 Tax=Moniliophthora roreri TaxID=221103 RepID=A0A0W0FTP6_MONRR|nr:hypothetical protein WG66_000869 [Moniliophthora roreri]